MPHKDRAAYQAVAGYYKQMDWKVKNRDAVNRNQREYRKANPDIFKRYNQKRNLRECERRKIFKQKINSYKAERGCVDCGIKNPIVLDFDHIKDKKFDIANGAARNPVLVDIEIEKCEIRCANCHRIKTHERRVSAEDPNQAIRADIKLEF